jgi:two-component system cell cycle sensor histidine kinase/response regulator CckA
LAYSRHASLHPVQIDVAESSDKLNMLMSRLLYSRIEISCRAAVGLLAIKVDKEQFDKVLINIALNASDAMQKCGRIRVRAKREAIRRKIYQTATDTLPPGNYVRIEVKDEGQGVMPQVLLRVFEPYFVAKRNGAGLSMARGFAEQSGGALMLKSAPGIGTIATLLLPASGDGAPPAVIHMRRCNGLYRRPFVRL